MKIKYLKLKNWLLVSLAGLLGINLSCEEMRVDEYGCPSANFNVKGKVTDPQGNPISGIQVKMDYNFDTTDGVGIYSVNSGGIPGQTTHFEVVFTDIDSTENGLYEAKTEDVYFDHSELTGGDGHWFEGSATKTLNVTLQPAEE